MVSVSIAQTPSRPLIIAHRGASGHAPENTLPAIKKAIEMDADLIEIDVHLTKDDSVIVIHDNTLNRTTNGKGSVLSHTYSEICLLDAGSWFSDQFKNEKIPTLREVLQTVNEQRKILIELKWPKKGIYDSLPKKVLEIVHACNAENWVIIQSFEREYLKTINQLNSQVPLHRLLYVLSPTFSSYIDYKPRFKRFIPASFEESINPSISHLKSKTVKCIKQSGRTVFVFTANSEKQIEKAFRLEVDGIITNYPDKVKAWLDAAKTR